jgi:hypothetical protein
MARADRQALSLRTPSIWMESDTRKATALFETMKPFAEFCCGPALRTAPVIHNKRTMIKPVEPRFMLKSASSGYGLTMPHRASYLRQMKIV